MKMGFPNHSKSMVKAILPLLFTILVIPFTGCKSLHLPSEQKAIRSIHEKKDLSTLDLLLEALHLEREDLGIHRPLPSKDPFLLSKVPLFLNNPLQVIPFAKECTAAFDQGQNSLSSILKTSADLLEIEVNPVRNFSGALNPAGIVLTSNLFAQQRGVISNGVKNYKREEVPFPEEINKIPASPLRQAIEILYPALVQAKKVFDEAFNALSKEEIIFSKRKIESLLFDGLKDKDLFHYQNQGEIEKAFFLASQISRKKMLQASYIVASALDETLKILDTMDSSKMAGFLKEEISTVHTPLGEILIGGLGDNHYTGKMPLLLIDLGGNDIYRFDEYSPFSVIIDLSGDDTYISSENCWLGAGVLGLGFLVDLKGNDIYRGENFAFGAGFFGVGFLLDREGNDRYISGMFSQGAGAIGLGILCDMEGDDHYQTALYSQGFGFVGAGGFLFDYRGNDIFFSGGVVPDHREESGAYRTLSQGFGLGLRPFASGGLGILYNGEGDDTYEGSYFSQGSAYWLSIWMIIDKRGNDHYKARRYSQGAGTHWAIGTLIDFEGDDHYVSWGVSQGCGHDRAIGILWDGQGNDHYSAEWLSQGAGNDSGRGFLIDEKGNDIYEAGTDGTQGDGKFDVRRDERSIGLLVDGDGEDIFSGKGRDQKLWKSGHLGGGIDYKGHLPTIWKESFRRDFVMDIPISSKFKDIREDKERSQFILSELEDSLVTGESWVKAADALSKQGPSVIPALLKYLEIKDVGVQRTLEETFKMMGEKYLEDLHFIIQKEDIVKAKKVFLLYVLGDIGSPESKGIFLKFLNDKDRSIQAMALRGLYKLKELPPVEDAFELSKSENMDVRRYLCLSLQSHQNPEFIPLLIGLQKDPDFNVRFDASEALKAFGQKTLQKPPSTGERINLF